MTDPHNNSPDDAAATVLAALKDLGIEHQVMDCDPELADTAVFCEHYGIPPEVSANVIIAVGKSDPRQYAACVLLATTRLDVNKCVRKKMGVKKCSFASGRGDQDAHRHGDRRRYGAWPARIAAALGRQQSHAARLHHPGWGQPIHQDQDLTGGL